MFTGILFAAVGCGDRKDDGVVHRNEQPDYVRSFDEQAMDKAIGNAGATWQQFSKALMNPTGDMTGFSIKRPGLSFTESEFNVFGFLVITDSKATVLDITSWRCFLISHGAPVHHISR